MGLDEKSLKNTELDNSDEDTIDVSTSSESEDYDFEPDESYRNTDFFMNSIFHWTQL